MCLGIALARSEVPEELIVRFALGRRRHIRGGILEEYRFYHDERDPRLPVWRDGQLSIARWGNRRGKSRRLPRTAWTTTEDIEAGLWAHSGAVKVEIRATFSYDGGVWHPLRRGIQGLLVPDEKRWAVAYMVTEWASHYYRVMTRSDWMPVFLGEQI